MEWPPKSGKIQSFPEIDRADWFNYPTAVIKVLKGQFPIIESLVANINYEPSGDAEVSNDSQYSLF
jgi:predicted NUDIX family NTP pyrophosphohydrolase